MSRSRFARFRVKDSGQHSADNLQLPLENGTVNEKGKINISEEVNRTTIWKQVNNCNVLFTKKQTPPATTDRQKHSQQLSKSSETEKRLSTMREEDEKMKREFWMNSRTGSSNGRATSNSNSTGGKIIDPDGAAMSRGSNSASETQV
uniref:Uncharacterized protein n=1 Tax=Anopheles culicifacies TaxID=139723 RepID=A0A182LUD1_9DIPT